MEERQTQPPIEVASKTKNGKSRNKSLALIVVALVVVMIVSGIWLGTHSKSADAEKSVNKDEYQALFLTNGQVYFGKLTDLNQKYITMSDIYYLQVQQTSAKDTGSTLQNASGSSDSSSQVSLAKLGNELHGPEDKMNVASDQILFWENMKKDSKVSQAITKYRQTR